MLGTTLKRVGCTLHHYPAEHCVEMLAPRNASCAALALAISGFNSASVALLGSPTNPCRLQKAVFKLRAM